MSKHNKSKSGISTVTDRIINFFAKECMTLSPNDYEEVMGVVKAHIEMCEDAARQEQQESPK